MAGAVLRGAGLGAAASGEEVERVRRAADVVACAAGLAAGSEGGVSPAGGTASGAGRGPPAFARAAVADAMGAWYVGDAGVGRDAAS